MKNNKPNHLKKQKKWNGLIWSQARLGCEADESHTPDFSVLEADNPRYTGVFGWMSLMTHV